MPGTDAKPALPRYVCHAAVLPGVRRKHRYIPVVKPSHFFLTLFALSGTLASATGTTPATVLAARSSAVQANELAESGDRLMQRSRDRIDPSLYAEARSAYQRALTADPRNVRAMLGLAWVANSAHQFAEGRRWAEVALAVEPELPDVFALLGDAEVELGDYDPAFAHYQRALDLRPDLASYSRAAHLVWLTGNVEKGVGLMQRAIAAGGPAPENTAWCRAQLALMLFHRGDLAAAEKLVDDALRVSSENIHLLNAAGRIFAARHRFVAAIACGEKSVALSPTHEALSLLVDLYDLTGQPAEAQARSDAVIAFHRTHAASHRPDSANGSGQAPAAPLSVHGSAQLALFLADHDASRLGDAVREARAAHRAFPNVFAADALAWSLFKSGQLKEAAALIADALKWHTPVAELQFHAGMIHAALGDPSRALAHLSEALRLNPAFHLHYARQAEEMVRMLRPGPVSNATAFSQ